ncbi:cytochrome c oxidase subunit II [Pseudosulfitobacter koreensis]|uniref:Cytochrome c oxidase subunit 2 n=1 Tax=Pseudosulfitobacter koreensis TaxID=2968472 RepID=A0ABT1Z368_9RHOB|nr:cytochrome c oxidase subunit II [Pseudosulfitobacter koreense]MCR8827582.1 cytochrome c oxidase subunit II [Pseudosulfitobacter koreense]
MTKLFSIKGLVSGLFAATAALPALAQDNLEIVGAPTPGAMGFQPAATELAHDLQWLDGMLLVIITIISLFVVVLLAWAGWRYNARRHPEPASFTHNSPIEIAWTVIPIVVLVLIGAFSLPILFKQQVIPDADVTIKVTGYQWYWDYSYVDEGFEFSSYMIGAPATGGQNMLTPEVIEQLNEAGYSEDEFLLATDNAVVVPVGKNIVMQVTGADVIHSWTIPAFGVKQDGIPGRLAELWFNADREGIYFGQCSELCGINHAYMPITVKVVSEEAYAAWLEEAREEFASLPQSFQVAAK